MADPAPPAPPRRASRLRRLVLAPLPLLVLLGLSELVLALFGLAPRDSLSRGFDPRARYLLPDPAVPGGHVTRIYVGEAGRSEFAIPPKGARDRVLLMGGSNTRYFPERYLERVLGEGAPPGHPGFEVINLGREGYGSERVAILLDQALEELDPDAVVIYSGHNEFIEGRFEDELVQAQGGPWVSLLDGWLAPLRTYGLVRELVTAPVSETDPSGDDGGRSPEKWYLAGNDYKDLTWQGTLRYLQAYERNLRRMCEAVDDADCALLLCTLPGNDALPPVSTKESPGLTDAQRQELIQLRRGLLVTMPLSPFQGLNDGRKLRKHEWWADMVRYDRREAPVLLPMEGFLAEAPATEGPPPSIAGAHWTDPAYWTNRVADALESYRRLIQREFDARQRAWLEDRRQVMERALELVPDDPAALYNLGLCTWLLDGEVEPAAALLRRAAALDRVPLAANDTINGIIRGVARDLAVPLLDVDAEVRACLPGGLVGFEVMMDHSHLQPGVATAVMDRVARRLLMGGGPR